MLKVMRYKYESHSMPPKCEQVEVHHLSGARRDPLGIQVSSLTSQLHTAQQALAHEKEVNKQLREQMLQIQASVTAVHVVGDPGGNNQ